MTTLKAAVRLSPAMSVEMMPLMVMASASVNRPSSRTRPLVMMSSRVSLAAGLTYFL